MLFGTMVGVILIPGLYYIFANIIEGKHLIRKEEDTTLSEAFVHNVDDFPVEDDEKK
jgi:HAE1 family hydrophobic/amphiphilic exporter-1